MSDYKHIPAPLVPTPEGFPKGSKSPVSPKLPQTTKGI